MENFRILIPSQPIEGLSLHSGGQSREVAVIQSEAKDLITFAALLGFRKVLVCQWLEISDSYPFSSPDFIRGYSYSTPPGLFVLKLFW
ncbi:hypothetical protein [Siphonobacter sp. SORGH_AS_0500]|uniref:hypothetical protein n=1 Tax=Siphonobacter sp. SORGH_AS_0500 TaxID=1864824 RepID=UPI00285984AF|nr:hypothetical protein [Siphonobacter sp. SORGH_AS_0500]MDR6197772.1 hypothetical protein [Siphonobacter sp. SORGH_AS_0500]